MFLLTVGLNHKTAPVEVREKLTFPEHTLKDALSRLRKFPGIEGCAILSTCNRTEIYATVLDVKQGLGNVRQFLANCLHDEVCEIDNYIYTHTLYDSVRHLFKVAAGLDSMILGETQILGQVRQAYQRACEYGATNAILNTLFQQAITVGKRVRTETEIDRNAVSISYAAVELGKQIFGTLEGKTILIIGAGKMSELTAKHLVANGVTSVLVANRSFDKSSALARQFGGEAIPYNQVFSCMAKADIVISCTAAPHYVIIPPYVTDVIAQRPDRPLFLIDIAVPRDIDPRVGNISGVKLYDIDDLQNVVDRNLEERRKEAVKAQKIVEEEITIFLKWLNTQFVTPTIVALKQKGEEIKEAELTKAFNKLGNLTEKEKKVISSLAHSVVNQLLHDPIINLKAYANTNHGHLYTEILQNLFNLEVEGQRPKRHPVGDELKKPDVAG